VKLPQIWSVLKVLASNTVKLNQSSPLDESTCLIVVPGVAAFGEMLPTLGTTLTTSRLTDQPANRIDQYATVDKPLKHLHFTYQYLKTKKSKSSRKPQHKL
jgi:hypothetical protein